MAKYRDWAGEFIDANLETGEDAQKPARHRGAPKQAPSPQWWRGFLLEAAQELLQ